MNLSELCHRSSARPTVKVKGRTFLDDNSILVYSLSIGKNIALTSKYRMKEDYVSNQPLNKGFEITQMIYAVCDRCLICHKFKMLSGKLERFGSKLKDILFDT